MTKTLNINLKILCIRDGKLGRSWEFDFLTILGLRVGSGMKNLLTQGCGVQSLAIFGAW